MNILKFYDFQKNVNKAFKTIGLKNPEKVTAIVYIIFFLLSCASSVGLYNYLTKKDSLPTVMSSGSNVALNTTGPVNQTIITTETQPRIESKISSEPKLESDGYYHTVYELTMIDGSRTAAPQNFYYNKMVFVKCLTTKFVAFQIRPNSGLINSIECLSKFPPSSDGELFTF